ncbi:MAG: carboxypeptidase-like regulatory domain-containing protein [Ilumatobacteraceae bacterium]
MSDDLVPVTGRTGPLRVGVAPSTVRIVRGVESVVTIALANDDDIIRSARVGIIGLDPAWAPPPPQAIAMFPGDAVTVDLALRLPLDFPAGARKVFVEVRDTKGDLVPALVEFDLLVEPAEQLALRVEPTNIDTGRRGTFTATVTNQGNSEVHAVVSAADPEQITRTTFVPEVVSVLPNAVGVARGEVRGRRPWFGTPVVRLLTVGAAAQPPGGPVVDPLAPGGPPPGGATTIVAVIQRPRFSRRLMTLLGLLLAATVFTVVLAATFAHLADQSKANAALLQQTLGGNASAAGAGTNPQPVTGTVKASTGQPLNGVAVVLYDSSRGPSVTIAQTVTDGNGAFQLANVNAGTYRVKFAGAGFADVWYPDAPTFDEGADVVVGGGPVTLDATLVGQPASITGTVTGDDLLGATVVVRFTAEGLPDDPDLPTTTVVAAGSTTSTAGTGPVFQTVAVDSAGGYTVSGLLTPRDYELTATKPGFVSRPRAVHVEPGDELTDIVLDLLKGDGAITGTVVDAGGQPVAGATVAASDGTNATSTVTLSAADASGAGAGTFELRNLITPGTFSLAVSADGFLTTNVTVRLDTGVTAPAQTIVLRPSVGRVGGTVSAGGPDAGPLGGVTVTVSGPEFSRSTSSLTTDPVGSWQITGVPLPGTYTVTFSATGYSTQAVGADLSPTVPENLGLDATLAPATSNVTGRAIEASNGSGIVGATVTLTGQGQTRTARTADVPVGNYGFSNLPPGAYTITFQRTGSPELTKAITLVPGDNPQPDAAIELPSGISGHVVVNGQPFAGAELRIYLLSAAGPVYPFDPPTATVPSDANGVYSSLGIPAGQYIVDLYIDGQIQPPSQHAAVSPGRPTENVDFDISTAPATTAPAAVVTTASATTAPSETSVLVIP